MDSDNTCPYCDIDTHGSGFLLGGGRIACQLCWYQRHPFKPRQTFREVIHNGEDQSLVYELLDAHLSAAEKARIVMEFNAVMSERYCKRLDALLRDRNEENLDD